MKNRIALIGLILLLAVLAQIFVLPVSLFAQPQVPPTKVDLVLSIVPGNYLDQVKPGKDNILYMELQNNGTGPVTNIRLSSTAPEGWVVDITPNTLDSLSAGSSHTVDVNVIPARNANKGNYNVTILAEATETRTAYTNYLRIEQSSPLWLWIGGGITAVVVTIFIIIFLRSGKQ